MTPLETTELTIFILILFVGIFSIIFGFPGTLVILIDNIIYSWISGFERISIHVIIILFFIALIAESLDFVFGIFGTKRYGASKRSTIAVIAGSIIGATVMTPFLLGFGTVAGMFLGGSVGTFFVEYLDQRRLKPAFRTGYGTFTGRVTGVLTKGLLALVMITISMTAIYS